MGVMLLSRTCALVPHIAFSRCRRCGAHRTRIAFGLGVVLLSRTCVLVPRVAFP